MLHILWVLIKILLILLAALLTLLLAAVFAVLLVPVRYRVSVKKNDGFFAQAAFTWLLHLLSVPVSFADGKLSFQVKICGFTVFGDKGSSKDDAEERIETDDRIFDEALEDDELLPEEMSEEDGAQTFVETPVKDDTQADESTPAKDEVEPVVEASSEDDMQSKVESLAESEAQTAEKLPLREDTPPYDRQPIRDEQAGPPPVEEELSPVGEPIRRKRKNPLQWVREIWQSVKRVLANVVNSLRNIKESIDSLKSKLEYYRRLWYDDHTQETVRHLKKEVLYLFGHIRPRNIRGWLHFGFDDPAATGQVLGILCILQAMSGNHLTVEADFQNPVFEGDFELKGHLRAVHFLKALLVLIMDKHCRITFRRFRKN